MDEDQRQVAFISSDPTSSLLRSKERRLTIEGYTPKGILKARWMVKHARLIPAVLTLFVNIDGWEDERVWRKIESDVISQFSLLKFVSPHQIPGLPSSVLHNPISADTIINLDITVSCWYWSTRARTSLKTTDFLCCAERLVQAMRDQAELFYKEETESVRRLLEQANPITQAALKIRYQFKVGFYSEFRQESPKAERHYKAAYAALMDAFQRGHLPGVTTTEIRTVAEYITLKILVLQMESGHGEDAVEHHTSHVRLLRNSGGALLGDPRLHFLFEAHLMQLHMLLAELLEVYGTVAFPSRPPVVPRLQLAAHHYHQAALDAIRRRDLFQKLCGTYKDLLTPIPGIEVKRSFVASEIGPDQDFVGTELLGSGQTSLEGILDADTETRLLFLSERTVPHSRNILDLLGRALDRYQRSEAVSPRVRQAILFTMGAEEHANREFTSALGYFSKLVQSAPLTDRSGRSEMWAEQFDDDDDKSGELASEGLMADSLAHILHCATQVRALPEFLTASVELLAAGNVLSFADRARIQSDLMRVLTHPSFRHRTEHCLHTHRSAIDLLMDSDAGLRTDLESSCFTPGPSGPIRVPLDPTLTPFTCSAHFCEGSVRLHDQVLLMVEITAAGLVAPLTFASIGFAFSDPSLDWRPDWRPVPRLGLWLCAAFMPYVICLSTVSDPSLDWTLDTDQGLFDAPLTANPPEDPTAPRPAQSRLQLVELWLHDGAHRCHHPGHPGYHGASPSALAKPYCKCGALPAQVGGVDVMTVTPGSDPHAMPAPPAQPDPPVPTTPSPAPGPEGDPSPSPSPPSSSPSPGLGLMGSALYPLATTFYPGRRNCYGFRLNVHRLQDVALVDVTLRFRCQSRDVAATAGLVR
ncbi:putative trafficking protein particle complex subunit 11 [Paratrimastix pyriformis]|uniref:Trafficking protein particle complex subunit 11 n=1 Tax=Paratrimastix pyriformis TaxID=342808 RepID=A0ABQ8UGJ9_9EUKA|nr:putative trafficking protein particle complex subunit 11 [Paratrimastix pyriformis]